MAGPRSDWSDFDDPEILVVDRLLDGTLDPAAVPADYAAVADLLKVIREGCEPAESVWGSPTIPAMSRILATAPRSGRSHSRRPSGPKRPASTPVRRHVLQTVGLTVVGVLSIASGAAATGHLPASMQSAAHRVVAAVGLTIPAPARPSTRDDPVGPARPASSSAGPAPSGATPHPGAAATPLPARPGPTRSTATTVTRASVKPNAGTVPAQLPAAEVSSPPASVSPLTGPALAASTGGSANTAPTTGTTATTVTPVTSVPAAAGTSGRGSSGATHGHHR
jgi:hypothetical protein